MRNSEGIHASSVVESGASAAALTVADFPYQPRDLIEWVQLRVKPITHKVSIGEEGQAFTQYEMELT